jgi:hypothetical protein
MKLFVKLFKHDIELFSLHDTQSKFFQSDSMKLKTRFCTYLIEAIWCQVVNKLRAPALAEKVPMSDGS